MFYQSERSMEAGDSQWWLRARNKISSDFDKSQFTTQWQPRNTNIRTFWHSEYFYYVTLHYCATTIAFDQAGIIIVALTI